MSQYLHFGVILITIPNLIVIGLMIVVFAAAVALSLPQERADQPLLDQPTTDQPTADE
ncbi:MAG TPA: hypothetical protein VMV29_21545 [Ktedonobacterales bacterium]|nr:hypothetical protein [Ktedonobacterales bacterium]